MAFCTNCGQPLAPGQKFCTKCGQKVAEAMTPPPAPQAAINPAPQVASAAPAPKSTVKMPAFITQKAAQVASASAAMKGGAGNLFDIKAISQKGEWVASSWDMPTLVNTTPTSWMTRIKNFFIPEKKLAYAWFLLPVLTTVFTIIYYIFHLIGKLFS